ncbi:hypothetical protein AURDEDRAFT_147252 [Auricularia subglabra TFB-10046 SS5]|nr:hypothetical protein AURDEDRAFT_147252 [Auricularia subglabra TFB-10046 SS5]
MTTAGKVKTVTITPSAGLVVKARRVDARGGPAKVFVNVAHDAHVPKPLSATPDAVRAALARGGGAPASGDFAVPLIVSDVRQVRDKAGAESLVVDVMLSPEVRAWMKDPDYTRFIVELCLQRVEQRHSMEFSRDSLAFPDIRSKGPLEPRDVNLPSSDAAEAASTPQARPLIEEVGEFHPGTVTPNWWCVRGGGTQAPYIVVDVPALTEELHAQTTLDLEPQKLVLRAGGVYALDIPFKDLPAPVNEDGLSASWRVKTGQLLISI